MVSRVAPLELRTFRSSAFICVLNLNCLFDGSFALNRLLSNSRRQIDDRSVATMQLFPEVTSCSAVLEFGTFGLLAALTGLTAAGSEPDRTDQKSAELP